jgi:5-methylcytosine-specific restriction enzyme subunit McrC
MNELFEDFVAIALREELRVSVRDFVRNGRGRPQRLDRGGRIGVEPDLAWWQDDQARFVGDVKYKSILMDGHNPDIYQSLAYATALGLPSAMLIYAQGEVSQRSYEILNSGKSIDVRTLDLSQPPTDVLAQVTAIADEIRAQVEGTGEIRKPLISAPAVGFGRTWAVSPATS